MDRGRRSRGSLLEPGADEEQSVGGERKMHPPLGHFVRHPSPDQQRRHTLWMTLEANATQPGIRGAAPTNLSPWMYDCWCPPCVPYTHCNKGRETHWLTHIHIYLQKLEADYCTFTAGLFLSQQFTITMTWQQSPQLHLEWCLCKNIWWLIYGAASHKLFLCRSFL